ncbi:MAG TPA: NUDIX domain-containing protein [Nocardioidaceae bacterium]|nr:NUDIX domain-containing protein [Nocardioidaceae bacterium]
MSEVVALVERSGLVVGSAERSVVRRDNLLHAATAVLVRNSAREIYLHRRSDTKDWAPGFHDCAAGGVMQHGETPAASAARELAEELGIRCTPLVSLGTSLYEDETTRCFSHCFEATWDGPVTHTDHEVSWGAWVTLQALDDLLLRPDFAFVPDTRQLLFRLAGQRCGEYGAMTHLTSGQQAPPGP